MTRDILCAAQYKWKTQCHRLASMTGSMRKRCDKAHTMLVISWYIMRRRYTDRSIDIVCMCGKRELLKLLRLPLIEFLIDAHK